MKERPILMSAPMVRAILEGRKTQTRRIVKSDWQDADDDGWPIAQDEYGAWHREKCKYGAVSDLLWVRETWARYHIDQNSYDLAYRATPPRDWPIDGRWRPSIHMPRRASRITLKITDLRIERLNSISEADAMAEGIRPIYIDPTYNSGPNKYSVEVEHGYVNAPTAKQAFSMLWEFINGQGSWAKNPWVWVIEFERQAHPNEGAQP